MKEFQIIYKNYSEDLKRNIKLSKQDNPSVYNSLIHKNQGPQCMSYSQIDIHMAKGSPSIRFINAHCLQGKPLL